MSDQSDHDDRSGNLVGLPSSSQWRHDLPDGWSIRCDLDNRMLAKLKIPDLLRPKLPSCSADNLFHKTPSSIGLYRHQQGRERKDSPQGSSFHTQPQAFQRQAPKNCSCEDNTTCSPSPLSTLADAANGMDGASQNSRVSTKEPDCPNSSGAKVVLSDADPWMRILEVKARRDAKCQSKQAKQPSSPAKDTPESTVESQWDWQYKRNDVSSTVRFHRCLNNDEARIIAPPRTAFANVSCLD